MRHRLLAGLLLGASVLVAYAEAPLFTPVPLLITTAPSAQGASVRHSSPGSSLVSLAAADRALGMGFPSLAADLYSGLLEGAADPSLDRSVLRLSLATALIEDGQLEKARAVLDGYVGVRPPAWRLRSALLHVRGRRSDAARGDLAGLKVDDFPSEDRAWFYFAQGVIADSSGAIDQGRDLYTQAIGAADSEIARVRISLAREQAYILRGNVNLDALRGNAERYAGQKIGFNYSKLYACGLAASGRTADSIGVLQRLLQSIPSTESGELDEVRLLLGLIGGAAPGSTGRVALFRLLETGQDVERLRMALHVLASASPPGVPGEEFVRKLDELAVRMPPHPILESLLLYRAEYYLQARNLEEASATARTLLDRFPASKLRLNALGVLTNAAWFGGRYLTAADFAERTRNAADEGPLRARLGVLVAESWYRAGNYRNAADSYAAALRTPPAGITSGVLQFQRVQAEIDAGVEARAQRGPLEAESDSGDDLQPASTLLDELARDPAFGVDSEYRWQAEWNLARALQAVGRVRPAYERVTRLLAPGTPSAISPTLRARMSWLQARLALDSGQPVAALAQATALITVNPALPAPLATEISSLASLVAAQAEFALNHPDSALAILTRLRASFPKTDAAVYSIIAEADYHISKDRIVEAQTRLRDLADTYPDTPYAPFALYRAALLAEQRGQESSYREANSLIEKLILSYPRSDLVFYARLHQGSLLVRLNYFSLAEQTYEELINKFSSHADILSARLALADCHSAQMGADQAHADRALELYEGLVVHPSASPDMRVEAGYKWGLSYQRRGELQRAGEVWWRDVVGETLAKPGQSSRLGAAGRYWMARTLFELSELLARQGRTDESRRALQLIIDSSATSAYVELARSRLANAGLVVSGAVPAAGQAPSKAPAPARPAPSGETPLITVPGRP